MGVVRERGRGEREREREREGDALSVTRTRKFLTQLPVFDVADRHVSYPAEDIFSQE